MTLIRGWKDGPETVRTLARVGTLEAERSMIYGGSGAARLASRKRLREISAELESLWAQIRRLRSDARAQR